jgi:hypothetical protein
LVSSSSPRLALPAILPPAWAALEISLGVSCSGNLRRRFLAKHREDQLQISHAIAKLMFLSDAVVLFVFCRCDAAKGLDRNDIG